MRLPKQLSVGFKPVKIVRRSDDPEDKDNGGTYSDKDRTIYIAKDTPEHEQGLAVLHELIHFFLAEHDLTIADKLEEAVCDSVSRGFAELMVRNPSLLPSVAKAIK